MTREEIYHSICEHIDEIEVNQKYPKETALYAALGIATDSNGNKTTKKIVSQYIGWEKSGKKSPSGGESKEIVITWVIDDPFERPPLDGRASNGGSRYKYSDKIAGVIADYLCSNSTSVFTYKQLYKDIYNISLSKLAEEADKLPSKEYRQRDYIDRFGYFLLQSTKSALNYLQKVGAITYSIHYNITRLSRYAPADLLPSNFSFEMDLSDFLLCLYAFEPKDESEQDVFLRSMEEYLCRDDASFHIQDYTLRSFIEKARKQQMKKSIFAPYFALRNDYISQNAAEEKITEAATESEAASIESINLAVARSLYPDAEQYRRKASQRNAVYEWSNWIFRLFGWESVAKVIEIEVTDAEKLRNQASEADARSIIEQYFSPRIANVYRNQKEVDAARIGLGPKPSTRGTMPEYNDYYLANNENINLLHCKFFELDEDPEYFKSFIQKQNL